MIKGVKKVPVLRYGLIVLLISVLFSGAFYLYLHYNSAQKLQTNISKLIAARENSELVDSCLLNLYAADNNSRLYALTGDKKYVKEFSKQINGLTALLNKISDNGGTAGAINPTQLKKLISEKTAKTNDYIKLRLTTDSLIKSTTKLDSQMATAKVKVVVPQVKTIKTTVHIDTVKPNKAAIGRELIEYSEKAEEYANNKSSFMASMSHEIRTPLNSVIGFSEQLAMSNLSTEQTVQINAIMSSSHMLLDVVNEILDFSKYETGKMAFEQQPFMVHKALEEVYNTVSIQATKKGISLKKNIDIDENVCFTGDMLRLKQVIMNLMVNAIKFTPVGEVALYANLVTEASGTALLKVRVKDSGIGIKKKNLPLIFNEFAQVSDAQKVTRHKGTGLGLAICKKIVELQGGKIKVASEPGKGSVFSFELPFLLADKDTCAVEQPIAETEMARHVKGINVLLAEDNQLNVLLAKTILKKWHINCDVANNGQEALDLFKEKSYDMVLTDIQMPVMGGMELLARIRNTPNILKAETPVVVLTANVLKEDRDRYKKAGANDIVLKPFAERNLIEKISLTMKNKFNDPSKFLMDYEDQTLL